MSALQLILIAFAIAITVFALLWVYQKRVGDSGIVDVAWGMGVGSFACFFCFFAADGDSTRQIVVAVLAMIWAVRLSFHVWQRLQKKEDGRYLEMVEQWGDQADWRRIHDDVIEAL